MPRLSDPITARLAVLELEQQGSTILRLDEQIANIRDDLHPGQLEFVDDNKPRSLVSLRAMAPARLGHYVLRR
jgi:hypothetical protein